jgi:hypothetical protein
VATISVSGGGANAEDIESIRYYAPRAFQIQERATSANDYAIMLRTQFPEISAISTYGGEELDPPQYGHVAIAIKIEDVDGLPDSKIQSYKNFLADKTSLTTRPIFVAPQFSYIAVRSTVNYNINLTALTPDNIRTLVILAIQDYAEETLGDFGGKFRYSRFCSMIDDVNAAIVGNETETLLYRKISPVHSTFTNVDVPFAMPLQKGVTQPSNAAAFEFHSVYSSTFILNGAQVRFADDGLGRLFMVSTHNGVDTFVNQVGTVNYDTGLVRLVNLKADDYDGTAIKVYVRPREKDILENQSTILDIEGGEIQVTVETVRE